MYEISNHHPGFGFLYKDWVKSMSYALRLDFAPLMTHPYHDPIPEGDSNGVAVDINRQRGFCNGDSAEGFPKVLLSFSKLI